MDNVHWGAVGVHVQWIMYPGGCGGTCKWIMYTGGLWGYIHVCGYCTVGGCGGYMIRGGTCEWKAQYTCTCGGLWGVHDKYCTLRGYM